MKYTVVNIEEDLDFGCEERDDDMPVQAVVTLSDETGKVCTEKFPDEHLVKEDIQTGDEVFIDDDGELKKLLSEDWTKNRTPQTVDIPKFVSLMEAVKEGKRVEWICPFCGSEVKRLEQEGGHTVIGCTVCDMRINLTTESADIVRAENETRR